MADNELEHGEGTIYRSNAQVRVAKLGEKERESMLSLAKKRAPDPSVFDDSDPFFFTTRASNDKVDAYWTWMDEGSLQNYVDDASDPGVQFQVSHNGASSGGFFGGGSHGEVGFGRSLGGEVKPAGRSHKEALIDFYTIRGLACGNVTSDAFIDGARAGIYADVSIGFMPGEMICNICGNDFLKRSFWGDDEDGCTHWPGKEYEIDSGKGKKVIRCILQVKNGRLHEVSLVYDGATPGAGIAAVDVARMMAANGDLQASVAQELENLYRVRIAPSAAVFALGETQETTMPRGTKAATTPAIQPVVAPPAEEREATDLSTDVGENPSPPAVQDEEVVAVEFSDEEDEEEAEVERSAEPLQRLRAKYEKVGLRLTSDDPHRIIEVLADKYLEQRDRLKTMTKDAERGKQAHEALLTDLDASVVRAFGAVGAEERKARYRRMAENEDLDAVRALIADLEERATARLGAGGRLTTITGTVMEGPDDEETPADRHDARGLTPHAQLLG